MSHRIATLLLGLTLTGCAAARNDFILLNPGTQYPSRAADAAVLLTVGDLDHPYQELGMIHVSGITREGYTQLNEKLRAKAREVGADAVIFVHYSTDHVLSIIPFFVAIPYDVLTVRGLAVRSKTR